MPRLRSTEFLRALAEEGVGIVVISSELPELIGLADRVIVVHEGRIAGDVAGDGLTQQNLIRIASGITEPSPGPLETGR